MGKILGPGLTDWSGKYAKSVVLKNYKGLNIFAALPIKPKIPVRSEKQLTLRDFMGGIHNDYDAFDGCLKDAFEKTNPRQSMRDLFMRYNLKRCGVYLTKEEIHAGAQVMANFQVSQGPESVSPVEVELRDGKFLTNIALGSLQINENTTVLEFAQAVHNNNLPDYPLGTDAARQGIVEESLRVIILHQYIKTVSGLPVMRSESYQLPLRDDEDASRQKLSGYIDLSKLLVEEVQLQGHTRRVLAFAKEGMMTLAVVHSRRKGDGPTLCSTQFMVGPCPLREQYLTAQAKKRAFDSYGGVNWYDNFNPNNPPSRQEGQQQAPSLGGLQTPTTGTGGQGGNQGNTDPTRFTISANASPTGSGNVSVSPAQPVASGTTVTLTATPNSGKRFVRWSDGNTQNPRTLTATATQTFTAIFEDTTPGGGSAEIENDHTPVPD